MSDNYIVLIKKYNVLDGLMRFLCDEISIDVFFEMKFMKVSYIS